jgi:predicted HicB family RNase H-like nuclease
MDAHRHEYKVRLPRELHQQLAAEAIRSDRSLNGEIVHRIRKSFEEQERREEAAAQ